MKRDLRLELSGIALVGLLFGFAWLTRHPDSELVTRAIGWPLVGPCAERFRARWSPPPPAPPPALEPVVEYHSILESDGPTAGRTSRESVEAGQVDGAAGLAREPAPQGKPPLRDGREPARALGARVAEPELVAAARAGLPPGVAERELGPYRLLTDLPADDERFERWAALATAMEASWVFRYGVELVGEPAETVVVYARARSFERFKASRPELDAAEANGLTVGGMVVLTAEGLEPEELEGTLQHELAHLLTRRSVGPALPPWLAEGLAEEFSMAPFLGWKFDHEAVRSSVTRSGDLFEVRGALAGLDRLARRAAEGRLPSLTALAAVDEREFASSEAGLERYAASSAWVRFLLSEPGHAAGFRAFLAAIAAGGEPSIAALERELRMPIAELEAPFTRWLAETSERALRTAGVPLGPTVRRVEPLAEVAPAALPPIEPPSDRD